MGNLAPTRRRQTRKNVNEFSATSQRRYTAEYAIGRISTNAQSPRQAPPRPRPRSLTGSDSNPHPQVIVVRIKEELAGFQVRLRSNSGILRERPDSGRRYMGARV